MRNIFESYVDFFSGVIDTPQLSSELEENKYNNNYLSKTVSRYSDPIINGMRMVAAYIDTYGLSMTVSTWCGETTFNNYMEEYKDDYPYRALLLSNSGNEIVEKMMKGNTMPLKTYGNTSTSFDGRFNFEYKEEDEDTLRTIYRLALALHLTGVPVYDYCFVNQFIDELFLNRFNIQATVYTAINKPWLLYFISQMKMCDITVFEWLERMPGTFVDVRNQIGDGFISIPTDNNESVLMISTQFLGSKVQVPLDSFKRLYEEGLLKRIRFNKMNVKMNIRDEESDVVKAVEQRESEVAILQTEEGKPMLLTEYINGDVEYIYEEAEPYVIERMY